MMMSEDIYTHEIFDKKKQAETFYSIITQSRKTQIQTMSLNEYYHILI